MNRILFDGIATQGTSRAKFHGGGEYAKFVLRTALQKGYEFDVVFDNRLFTDPEIDTLLRASEHVNVYKVDNIQDIYNLIEEKGITRFYSAQPALFPDYKGSAEFLGVIHGLRSIELPWDEYRYKYYTHRYMKVLGCVISRFKFLQSFLKNKHIKETAKFLSLRNAKFITVSKHTKYSLMHFFPNIGNENIQVFYSPFSVGEIGRNPKDNYFLMVSANRYEKNVYRAVKVFDNLFSKGHLIGKKVIITGCSEQPFWGELKNKSCFELLPYVSKEKLENLYKKAFCFVYPSLNEGFGYPPLNAMAYGTPVIASSATSIPEVCDDAACYFSPTNMDDLAVRLLRIDLDDEYRSLLIDKGMSRVNKLLEQQKKEIDKEIKMIFE